MKLVGKCKEPEYCIIVYRPFQQQFMRIKAQKWGFNKVLFEKQPVPDRATLWFWSSTVLCCISSCNLLFLNISELVPVVLCPDLLRRFYLLNWWNLILFFFPPIPWTSLSPHDEVSGLFDSDLGLKSKDAFSFFPPIQIKKTSLLIDLLFPARNEIIFQLCKVMELSPVTAWNGSIRIKYLMPTEWTQGLLET